MLFILTSEWVIFCNRLWLGTELKADNWRKWRKSGLIFSQFIFLLCAWREWFVELFFMFFVLLMFFSLKEDKWVMWKSFLFTFFLRSLRFWLVFIEYESFSSHEVFASPYWFQINTNSLVKTGLVLISNLMDCLRFLHWKQKLIFRFHF